jgi:hypothetical protein
MWILKITRHCRKSALRRDAGAIKTGAARANFIVDAALRSFTAG